MHGIVNVHITAAVATMNFAPKEGTAIGSAPIRLRLELVKRTALQPIAVALDFHQRIIFTFPGGKLIGWRADGFHQALRDLREIRFIVHRGYTLLAGG